MHTRNNFAALVGLTSLAISALAPSCVFNSAEECQEKFECAVSSSTSGPGGNGGTGGMAGEGGTGALGGGGMTGGGGTGGDLGCMDHDECAEIGNAQCDNGICAPCSDSSHCTGVAGLPVCDEGTCVECKLGEDGACVGMQTCDLLAKECVGVAPGTVDECEPCTNDAQCITNFACIPLDFPSGTLHGYYCVRPFPPSCDQPFAVPALGKVSISGAAAANYCAVDQDLATCEAVRALFDDWHCTGTDGMCSALMGGMEVSVPGALCRDLGGGAQTNKCTYACAGAGQCLSGAPADTCGDFNGTANDPPDYCGGL